MKTIILFDVDGTLTKSRNLITQEMLDVLEKAKSKVTLGLVGGSDFKKIDEQIPGCVQKFEYVFTQNGLVAFKQGEQIHNQSFHNFLGEEKMQEIINFSLRYIADLKIPVKRGTFIEFRQGMLNVCPIGRNCTQEEREQFSAYDKENHIRQTMVEAFQKNFPSSGLTFAIGGEISIDIFPNGWDKTYCLQQVQKDGYDEIIFFGDKTMPGGNDHEIFEDSRTKGYSVTNYSDTIKQLTELLKL